MGLYFEPDETDDLIRSVAARTAAEYLGLRQVKNSILCPLPGHHDEHYGNCNFRSDGSCFCYACDKPVSSLQILMHAGGYSYYESLCILAELSGRTEEFESKKKNGKGKSHVKPVKTLSISERELLGLTTRCRGMEYLNGSDIKPKEGTFKRAKGGYVTYAPLKDQWNDFAKEDPDVFSWMVRNKCVERIVKIDRLILAARNPFGGNLSKVVYEMFGTLHLPVGDFIRELKGLRREIENIYIDFGGKLSGREIGLNHLYNYYLANLPMA